jgi:hypothetical protein
MQTEPSRPFRHAAFQGRLGIARCEITPPIGVYARNWGAAKHDTATSVHRPLTLTALVLSSIDQPAPAELVYIDADLGWWKTPTTYQRFFARLYDSLAVNAANMLFALSHTHSGPPLMDAEESLPGSDLLNTWMEHLFVSTVNTVRAARASQFEGRIEWHTGRCGLATNRDLPSPEKDQHRIVCGYNPAGTPDDTLIVGRVTDLMGSLRATITNYACHPTTLAWDNRSISPDYVGAMRATLQEETGVPSLFMLGACGDLAPRYQYVGDTAVADRHGRQLAFATLATLHDMEPPGEQLRYAETVESGAALAVWRHEPVATSTILRAAVTDAVLPLKNWPSAEELERQRLATNDRAIEERLRRQRDIRLGLGNATTFALPVYAWRVGDAVLVGSCCEPYSLLQQELRRRFPGQTILCMNLVNGSIGYLPPAARYDEVVYPVWQTPFDRGSFEITLEIMTEAIQNA